MGSPASSVRRTLVAVLSVALVVAVAVALRSRDASARHPSTTAAASGAAARAARAAASVHLPVATVGALRTVPISGTTSHFAARSAVIYLPPAALLRRPPTLPVLELLHGTPGRPTSWVQLGDALQTFEAFARAHGGRGPIVVMPDINGTLHGDSECIRAGDGGDVEQYLTVDVPDYIHAHYPQATHARWSVGGLSEGGTCSLMLALRHPSLFANLVDLSGLTSPTVGDRVDPDRTIAALFDGSRTDYDEHDPLWLLRRDRYPGDGAWFEVGVDDTRPAQAQRTLVPLARAAGMSVVAREVSGKHGYAVWRAALVSALPWVWARSGSPS